MIDALLPWPPSVNAMYGNSVTGRSRRGRFPTKRYAEWHQDAMAALHIQNQTKPISGPVTIDIKLNSPTRRQYDLDNRVKPILDLLTSLTLIEDDNANIVTKITVGRGDGFTGAWILVQEAA